MIRNILIVCVFGIEMVKKEKNATLIITEKPAAAAKIAAALSGASDEKITNRDKVSYYEFYKGSRRYIVGCAVGHLFGIQQIAKRGPFPNFEVEWVGKIFCRGKVYK